MAKVPTNIKTTSQKTIIWPKNLKFPITSSWRINQSSYPPIELANVLKALQKLAGAFPGASKQVAYSQELGLSYNKHSGQLISIDPYYANHSGYPLNPHAMDILCGLTIHEVGHSLVDSEVAIPAVEMGSKDLSAGRISVNSIAIIGEEIYCDNYVRRHHPKLNHYLQKARIAYKVPREQVNWNDILKSWLAISVYGELPNNKADIELLACLNILLQLAGKLRQQDLTTTNRRSLYASAALAIQTLLSTSNSTGVAPSFPQKHGRSKQYQPSGPASHRGEHYDEDDWEIPTFQSTKDAYDGVPEPGLDNDQDGQEDGGNKPNGDGEGNIVGEDILQQGQQQGGGEIDPNPLTHHPKTISPSTSIIIPMHQGIPLPKNLQHQIVEAIEQEQEDLTQVVESNLKLAGLESTKTFPIIKSVYKSTGELSTDKTLLPELQYLQRLKHAMGLQTIRGEPWGRIDQRNLHRAFTDGHPYKQIVKKPRQARDIVLLLDGSNSMQDSIRERLTVQGRRGSSGATVATIVYPAAKAVFDVLKTHVHLYSYTTDYGNTVSLKKHSSGHKVSKIPSGNQTPSGLALLAAAELHPKSLIIHFTDGHSNTGPDPNQVFPILEKEYPSLNIVEINYRKDRDYGDRNYSPHTRIKGITISNIYDFPEQLRKALEPWFMIR